jgi:hypothetical protein
MIDAIKWQHQNTLETMARLNVFVFEPRRIAQKTSGLDQTQKRW